MVSNPEDLESIGCVYQGELFIGGYIAALAARTIRKYRLEELGIREKRTIVYSNSNGSLQQFVPSASSRQLTLTQFAQYYDFELQDRSISVRTINDDPNVPRYTSNRLGSVKSVDKKGLAALLQDIGKEIGEGDLFYFATSRHGTFHSRGSRLKKICFMGDPIISDFYDEIKLRIGDVEGTISRIPTSIKEPTNEKHPDAVRCFDEYRYDPPLELSPSQKRQIDEMDRGIIKLSYEGKTYVDILEFQQMFAPITESGAVCVFYFDTCLGGDFAQAIGKGNSIGISSTRPGKVLSPPRRDMSIAESIYGVDDSPCISETRRSFENPFLNGEKSLLGAFQQIGHMWKLEFDALTLIRPIINTPTMYVGDIDPATVKLYPAERFYQV